MPWFGLVQGLGGLHPLLLSQQVNRSRVTKVDHLQLGCVSTMNRYGGTTGPAYVSGGRLRGEGFDRGWAGDVAYLYNFFKNVQKFI